MEEIDGKHPIDPRSPRREMPARQLLSPQEAAPATTSPSAVTCAQCNQARPVQQCTYTGFVTADTRVGWGWICSQACDTSLGAKLAKEREQLHGKPKSRGRRAAAVPAAETRDTPRVSPATPAPEQSTATPRPSRATPSSDTTTSLSSSLDALSLTPATPAPTRESTPVPTPEAPTDADQVMHNASAFLFGQASLPPVTEDGPDPFDF